ncbi:MAG: DUF302 domain-containing protein [Alphaproteobacteria bacterium]
MLKWLRGAVLVQGLVFGLAGPAAADQGYPDDGMQVIATPHNFGELWKRLEDAIAANKMGLVSQASASVGASRRGVLIPGNAVIGVYRNDFAVRMLEASVPAGIEAPLRFYLTANADDTATLAYRLPSATFAPYGSDKLDAMAKELDVIFAAIAADATKP